MVQEWNEDFSTLEVGEGCCLNCSDAHTGCLCYECKCKQCYWYSSPEQYNGMQGHCDKTDLLKEKRKEEIKYQYEIEAKEKAERMKKLEQENNVVLIEMQKEKRIPNYYSCQKCGKEIVNQNSLEIREITNKTSLIMVFVKKQLWESKLQKNVSLKDRLKEIRKEIPF